MDTGIRNIRDVYGADEPTEQPPSIVQLARFSSYVRELPHGTSRGQRQASLSPFAVSDDIFVPRAVFSYYR